MATVLETGETILFVGDSITDGDRRDDLYRPLGRGYVRIFHDMLVTRDSEKTIRVLNQGVGGNSIEDLRSRWTDDVLAHKADWLVVAIGINDINQHLSNHGAISLDPKTYEEIYAGLLELTTRALPKCRLILIDPFYASKDTVPGSYRTRLAALLPDYLAAVSRLAAKFAAHHLRMHEIFAAKLAIQHPSTYFPIEPVHPNSAGHFLIAESLYKLLEVSRTAQNNR